MFWGKPAQPGSFCNLRKVIRHVQVDKGVKVFNVGDEFAHLTVGILTQLSLTSTSDPLTHTESSEWLNHTAKKLVSSLLMPHKSVDAVYIRDVQCCHVLSLAIHGCQS